MIYNYLLFKNFENFLMMNNAYGVHMPKQELSYSEGRKLILERFYNS